MNWTTDKEKMHLLLKLTISMADQQQNEMATEISTSV